jgi:hypothetical protein
MFVLCYAKPVEAGQMERQACEPNPVNPTREPNYRASRFLKTPRRENRAILKYA